MTAQGNRQRILDFCQRFYSLDLDRSMAFYADDIDYVSHVPVDILPHLGQRRGKAEIRDTFAQVYSRYSSMRYDIQVMVADEDRVALINRVFFKKALRDRIVQMDIANFYTLRDGLIVKQREFLDSYDLVQQVLEIDIASAIKLSRPD